MMVTKRTLYPNQPGAKRWKQIYGDRLLCVRYKYDTDKNKKMISVELLVEEKDWIKNKGHIPHNKLFHVRIKYGEIELGKKVRSFGGVWEREVKLWKLNWAAIQALGLEERIIYKKGQNT